MKKLALVLMLSMVNVHGMAYELERADALYKAHKSMSLGHYKSAINRYQKYEHDFNDLEGDERSKVLLNYGDALNAAGLYDGWDFINRGIDAEGKRKRFSEELKKGQVVTQDTVVVIDHEKGLGDIAQFGPRYAQVIKEQTGATVVMTVPFGRLKSVFSRCKGIDALVTGQERAEAIEKYKADGKQVVSIPLFALPLFFSAKSGKATRVDSIPFVTSPTIMPNSQEVERFSKHLSEDRALVKLLVCWHAGPEIPLARPLSRDVPLNQIITAVKRSSFGDNVSIYSLQGPEHRPVSLEDFKQIQEQQENGTVDAKNKAIDKYDVVDNVNDIRQIPDLDSAGAFEGTIAIAQDSRAVPVSCDTSVFHFIASTGKRTYLLAPKPSDWRNESAPWYQNGIVLKQEKSDDWSGPIASLIQFVAREHIGHKA